jgi:hypothetical protein
MRKLHTAWTIVFFMFILLTQVAEAAPLNMLGTWKGTAKKINENGVCTNVAVTVVIKKQCPGSNVFSGTITIGNKSLPGVGRIGTSSGASYFTISGTKIGGTGFTSLSVFGLHKASPSRRIIVDGLSSSEDDSNIEYSEFPLVKQ